MLIVLVLIAATAYAMFRYRPLLARIIRLESAEQFLHRPPQFFIFIGR